MGNDIAPDEHVQRLKNDLYLFTNDLNFKNAKNGECFNRSFPICH
jgi:hypothetical protein